MPKTWNICAVAFAAMLAEETLNYIHGKRQGQRTHDSSPHWTDHQIDHHLDHQMDHLDILTCLYDMLCRICIQQVII